jgi:hypothetical protein
MIVKNWQLKQQNNAVFPRDYLLVITNAMKVLVYMVGTARFEPLEMSHKTHNKQ